MRVSFDSRPVIKAIVAWFTLQMFAAVVLVHSLASLLGRAKDPAPRKPCPPCDRGSQCLGNKDLVAVGRARQDGGRKLLAACSYYYNSAVDHLISFGEHIM